MNAGSINTAVLFAFDYLVVAASPGPNFLLVSQAGLMGSRAATFRAAAGITLGIAALTVLLASCVQWLPREGWPEVLAKSVFAAVLLRWAWRSLRRAWRGTSAGDRTAGDPRHFRSGFLTALSNPFTAAFIITATGGRLDGFAAASVVLIVAGVWFNLVGLAFCQPRMRAFYARRERAVEGAFGLAFLAMALRAIAQIVSA